MFLEDCFVTKNVVGAFSISNNCTLALSYCDLRGSIECKSRDSVKTENIFGEQRVLARGCIGDEGVLEFLQDKVWSINEIISTSEEWEASPKALLSPSSQQDTASKQTNGYVRPHEYSLRNGLRMETSNNMLNTSFNEEATSRYDDTITEKNGATTTMSDTNACNTSIPFATNDQGNNIFEGRVVGIHQGRAPGYYGYDDVHNGEYANDDLCIGSNQTQGTVIDEDMSSLKAYEGVNHLGYRNNSEPSVMGGYYAEVGSSQFLSVNKYQQSFELNNHNDVSAATGSDNKNRMTLHRENALHPSSYVGTISGNLLLQTNSLIPAADIHQHSMNGFSVPYNSSANSAASGTTSFDGESQKVLPVSSTLYYLSIYLMLKYSYFIGSQFPK